MVADPALRGKPYVMSGSTIVEPVRASRPDQDGGGTPPGDGGDGGGGGGGGDGDPPGEGSRIPISTAKLGMMILLCSLVMLFAGFVTVYTVLRFSSPTWPPPGMPPLPKTLWGTTGVIVLSGVTMALAVRSARQRRAGALRASLAATTVLGLLFVAGQLWAWDQLHDAGVKLGPAYGTVFYTLTGIHAAHVVGGVVMLLFVLGRALLGRYDDGKVEGVELVGMYWHFVDAMWLVLFGLL